jgi:hypothetical protein
MPLLKVRILTIILVVVSLLTNTLAGRIHFKLHYDDLDEVSRATVWKNCLGSGPSDLARPNFSDEEIKSLAKLKLNGRQVSTPLNASF